MQRRPEELKVHVRGVLQSMSVAATFADNDDVFERGIVRSLNLLELIVAIEDSYGFEISQSDVFAGHLRSVDRVVAFVLARSESA